MYSFPGNPYPSLRGRERIDRQVQEYIDGMFDANGYAGECDVIMVATFRWWKMVDK